MFVRVPPKNPVLISDVFFDTYHLIFTISFRFSDYLFKLLLIGDSGVGKSCLLLRFSVSEKTTCTHADIYQTKYLICTCMYMYVYHVMDDIKSVSIIDEN